MDYRNDNRTPRDRVDDEFFRSLLREEDEAEEPRNSRERTRMTNARMSDSHMQDNYMQNSRTRNSRMQNSRSNDCCIQNSRSNDCCMQNSRTQNSCMQNSRTQNSCMRENGRSSRSNNYNCPMSWTQDDCLASFPLGMVYTPVQSFRNIMEPCTALHNGTIFTELNLPFYHSGCKGDMCR